MTIEILEHHYPKLLAISRTSRLFQAIAIRKEIRKTQECGSKDMHGVFQPDYPVLRHKVGRERMGWELTKMALAIRSGNYKIIPDKNPETGKRNFDGLCHVCGRRVFDQCTVPGGERITIS